MDLVRPWADMFNLCKTVISGQPSRTGTYFDTISGGADSREGDFHSRVLKDSASAVSEKLEVVSVKLQTTCVVARSARYLFRVCIKDVARVQA